MKSGYQIRINEKTHLQSQFATGMYGVVSRVYAMHLNNVYAKPDGMEKDATKAPTIKFQILNGWLQLFLQQLF